MQNERASLVMANTTNLYKVALAADDAFQAAVVKQFGKKNAGDMRYQPKLHNAETKAAYEAFSAASDAWLNSMKVVA